MYKPQSLVFYLKKELAEAYTLLVIGFAITLALLYLAREESHFEISASIQKPLYEKQFL